MTARVTGPRPATAGPAAAPASLTRGPDHRLLTGIGQATALRLHAAGFAVDATARQPESLAGLAAAGITTLRLDVTDEASMTAVAGRITAGTARSRSLQQRRVRAHRTDRGGAAG
jgi:hypothetical protein